MDGVARRTARATETDAGLGRSQPWQRRTRPPKRQAVPPASTSAPSDPSGDGCSSGPFADPIGFHYDLRALFQLEINGGSGHVR
jgi:hypothetical protein